jgi:hypothetical protein
MSTRRPGVSEYDTRYAQYIDLVPESDLPQALSRQIDQTRALITAIPPSRIDLPYAPGEWTAREILGHLLDSERIFGFRLLCFARGDNAALARADQDMYVRHAQFDRYVFADLFQEFALVRASHVSLLSHLPVEAWDRVGVVGGLPISVRAIAFLMLGHERHHLATIRANYLHDGA